MNTEITTRSADGMVTTCFFCQNLLSDYIEGILPASRQEELRKHISSCRGCSEVEADLQASLKVLHAIPSRPLSHEMALRITESSQAGSKAFFSRTRLSRVAMVLIVPVLIFGSAVALFPSLFPWFTRFRVAEDQSQFARYYPMLQNAGELIEEQANWLHLREPFMRSLWEEGGLSPEEFEKSFQGQSKGGKGGEGEM